MRTMAWALMTSVVFVVSNYRASLDQLNEEGREAFAVAILVLFLGTVIVSMFEKSDV